MVQSTHGSLESFADEKVAVIPIFSIDLNRFTSGASRVRILTYE